MHDRPPRWSSGKPLEDPPVASRVRSLKPLEVEYLNCSAVESGLFVSTQPKKEGKGYCTHVASKIEGKQRRRKGETRDLE